MGSSCSRSTAATDEEKGVKEVPLVQQAAMTSNGNQSSPYGSMSPNGSRVLNADEETARDPYADLEGSSYAPFLPQGETPRHPEPDIQTPGATSTCYFTSWTVRQVDRASTPVDSGTIRTQILLNQNSFLPKEGELEGKQHICVV